MANPRAHFQGHHYEEEFATGPLRALNPTSRWHAADKKLVGKDGQSAAGSAEPNKSPAVYYVWRSRDNRKGRHAIAVDPAYRSETSHTVPVPTNTAKGMLDGIVRMLVKYPVWDVSYDVAVIFTVGSVIWVINGFFSWLPVVAPSTEFSKETTWGAGITALVGATVFEFGSILLMLEAVNENRSDCFGWAVEQSLDGILDLHPEARSDCTHSHASKKTFVSGSHGEQSAARRWVWWPTWHELTTHYIREIGFLACAAQMFGATVFWISGFTALPPILNALSLPAQNGAYWLPQVIGGVGFIVSSLLFMIEVQPNWYTPAPSVLGWHIGLWNLIGAIGFALCGALGFDAANPSVFYALGLSTFIGSWAFLLGSAIQWYESLSKYPIWVDDASKKLAEQKDCVS